MTGNRIAAHYQLANRIKAVAAITDPDQQAAAITALVNEIQHEQAYDEAWIEYCYIECIDEKDRVSRELGAAQRAGYDIPRRDAVGDPVESPVRYVTEDHLHEVQAELVKVSNVGAQRLATITTLTSERDALIGRRNAGALAGQR